MSGWGLLGVCHKEEVRLCYLPINRCICKWRFLGWPKTDYSPRDQKLHLHPSYDNLALHTSGAGWIPKLIPLPSGLSTQNMQAIHSLSMLLLKTGAAGSELQEWWREIVLQRLCPEWTERLILSSTQYRAVPGQALWASLAGVVLASVNTFLHPLLLYKHLTFPSLAREVSTMPHPFASKWQLASIHCR